MSISPPFCMAAVALKLAKLACIVAKTIEFIREKILCFHFNPQKSLRTFLWALKDLVTLDLLMPCPVCFFKHCIMKFSFQLPKCYNWFKHFLAISCKIPWKFMSKIVWNFWNCLWFAEKMWEIWDFSNLSKVKFPKNYRSISSWKWR